MGLAASRTMSNFFFSSGSFEALLANSARKAAKRAMKKPSIVASTTMSFRFGLNLCSGGWASSTICITTGLMASSSRAVS